MKITGLGSVSVELELEIIDELPRTENDGEGWKNYLAMDKEGRLYEVFTWPPNHDRYTIDASTLEHLAIKS